MSYRFSGSGGSHALRTSIGTGPFPIAFPFSFAVWATYDDITTNASNPFSMHIDSDAGGQRTSAFSLPSSGIFRFFLDDGPTNSVTDVTYPLALQVGDWVLQAFCLKSATTRTGYVVHNGVLFQASNADTMSMPAFDRVTMGYLPFFGDIQPHQGRIGSGGVWDRTLSEPEIIRMGRGEPLENFHNDFLDGWHLDGRQTGGTIRSINGTMDLTTIDGPPAYDLEREPRTEREELLWVPSLVAAADPLGRIIQPDLAVLQASYF